MVTPDLEPPEERPAASGEKRRRSRLLALTAAGAMIAVVAVSVGAAAEVLNSVMKESGSVRISGSVRAGGSGEPLAGVRVHALGGQPCCTTLSFADTDANGEYELRAPAGDLIVQFSPDARTGYVWEYWDDKPTMFSSVRLRAGSGQLSRIDATLERGFKVEIMVRDQSGTAAPAEVRVYASSPSKPLDYVVAASPSGTGSYVVTLPSGTYGVGLYPPAEDCCEGPPAALYDLVVDGSDRSISVALP